MLSARKSFVRTTGLGLVLTTALALGAGPLLAECQNQNGTERECTPSEEFRQCVAGAEDAFDQCIGSYGSSYSYFELSGCSLSWVIDRGFCSVDLARSSLK